MDSDGGRPRALLQMDPDYGRVVGVDVGETRIRVEMFDMTMALRASADYHLDAQEQGIDVVVDRINAGLASVLADGGCVPSAVLGAGIGVPGVIEHEGEEALVYAQTYGWDAVPLDGCCGRPTSRCTSTTARRRWGRPNCGSAAAAAPVRLWSA